MAPKTYPSLSKGSIRAVTAAAGCLFLVLSAMLNSVEAGTTGGLHGRVLDASSQQPLAGARITVASASQTAGTSSDVHGLYTFVSLVPDTYSLSAAHDG